MRCVQHRSDRAANGLTSHDERGSALVELALVLPLLMLLLLGTIDFGRAFYTALAVTHAARAGAEYGMMNAAASTDFNALSAAMVTTAQSAVQADIGTISVPIASCETQCLPNEPGNAGNLDGLTSTACSSTPPACSGQRHVAMFVTVQTSKTFTLTGAFPGLPSSVPISRTERLRAQ